MDGQTGQSDGIPWCPDPDGDGFAAPPPPPTHPEIVAALCSDATVPDPVIGTSPPDRGITGLETWLYDATDPQPTTTTGTIRTYPVACTVTPTTWSLDTGDPHAARFGHPSTYTSDNPGGDREDTDLRHQFEVAGTWPLAMTVTWQRTTSTSGQPTGSDSLRRTTGRDYPVDEIVTTNTR